MKPGSRILVVDDNEDFRMLLVDVLQGRGFTVVEAGDGVEALSRMASTAPQMAIVDLDMPKMDGMEFARRAKDANPAFPVVIVTGYAKFYSPEEILATGVDAFLQKPIHMERLFEVIEKL